MTDSLFRELEHPLASIDAINLKRGMRCEQFAQEPSVPLAHDESAPRRTDFAETSDARSLEGIPKCDCLQRPIPRRDGIEAHNATTISAITGVSRTRSASAVRSLVPKELDTLSQMSSNALTPMHAKIGAKEEKTTASAKTPNARRTAILPAY